MFRKIFSLFLLLAVLACSKDSDVDPGPDPIDKSANLLATGDSANDILSNDAYSKMVIEAAYVTDYRPTQAAMDDFVNFLRDRTFKTDISVVYRSLPSPNLDRVSIQDIADLESENRTLYNSDDTLAVYIYFTDGMAEGDDPDNQTVTLGAVYRNTSMVVYEKTIRDLADQSFQISDTDVETATLTHEFGHLFGLVDLGTPEVNPHEDATAENHCDISGCLMRAELQFGGGIMGVLESRVGKGNMVPDLDSECLLDLQANGGR